MTIFAFNRPQKALVLAPLAALSAAWTFNIASVDTVSAHTSEPGTLLPDGQAMPTETIETPASVYSDAEVRDRRRMVRTASTNGIPSAALAAYQRAESVMDAADVACRLPWQLVAAIGRVESDHGRFGGATIDQDGVSRPAIIGIPLDGTHGTAAIPDTDAGEVDGDRRWDRAVGPMQFIPATWRVVGVDSDGDGERNPHDIDDAALATAVYLCSGEEDLSTRADQEAAVFRYNHSREYVALVLSIMNAYLHGDYTPVPNGVTTETVVDPGPGYDGAQPGDGQGPGSDAGAGETPTQPSEPTQQPTQQPTDGPTEAPTQTPTQIIPTQIPTQIPTEVPTQILTEAEALAQCVAEGVVDNPLTSVNELLRCVEDKLGG